MGSLLSISFANVVAFCPYSLRWLFNSIVEKIATGHDTENSDAIMYTG